MIPSFPLISQVTRSGVSFLSPQEGHVGPVQAEMVFRVGTMDEMIPERGLSRLVQQLVLTSLTATTYSVAGAVTLRHTTFTVTGTPEEVAEGLTRIGIALSQPSLDQWDELLEQMQASLPPATRSRVAKDLAARCGARGPGTAQWREYGLLVATPAAVREWMRHWFVDGNCVTWINAPLPPTLRVSLPGGPPPLHQRSQATRVTGRQWLTDDESGLSLSFLVPTAHRSVEMVVATTVQTRAADVLAAHLNGAPVRATVVRLDSTLAICHVRAGCSPASQRACLDGLAGVVVGLSEEGPTQDECRALTNHLQRDLADPARMAQHLRSSALRLLDREEIVQPHQLFAAMAGMTADDIAAPLSGAPSTFLGIGASFHGHALPGWAEIRPPAHHAVDGDTFWGVSDVESGAVTVGEGGITKVAHARGVQTVLWDECVAGFHWDTGAWRVVGVDGTHIVIVPSAYDNAELLSAQLGHRVRTNVRIALDGTDEPPPQAPAPLAVAVGPAVVSRDDASGGAPRLHLMKGLLGRRHGLPLAPSALTFSPAPLWPVALAAYAQLQKGNWRPLVELLEGAVTFDERGVLIRMFSTAPAFPEKWLVDAHSKGLPLLVRGSFLVRTAWNALGRGDRDKIPPEQERTFFRLLNDAHDNLTAAAAALPGDPEPWSSLIWVATGLDAPLEERRNLFRQAASRARGYRPAHVAIVEALSPRFGGGEGIMMEAADEMDRTLPDGSSARIALLWAHEIAACHQSQAELAGEDASSYYYSPAVGRAIAHVAAHSVLSSQFVATPDSPWPIADCAFALSHAGLGDATFLAKAAPLFRQMADAPPAESLWSRRYGQHAAEHYVEFRDRAYGVQGDGAAFDS